MTNDRLNLTECDFRLQDEGTIVVLHPVNDAAREWIDENLYGDEGSPMWWGGGVAIEHRCAEDIVQGLLSDGFVIGR